MKKNEKIHLKGYKKESKTRVSYIVKIIGFMSLILIMSTIFTFAYYTNVNKYFIDSRKDDGFGGLALERESNEFIEDGCGVGTMLDTLTGICWLKNMNTYGSQNWATASSECSNLDYAGHTNWVLPTRDELSTLMDEIGASGSTCSTLMSFNFIDCRSSYYWTQDVNQVTISNMWVVNLDGNSDGSNIKTVNYFFTCVVRNY